MASESIQVAIRVRPLNQHEAAHGSGWIVNGKTIQSKASDKPEFSFDHVFDESTESKTVYTAIAQNIVEKALQGYNGTIFAYGQTSSGKTHSMTAIMNGAIEDIFRHTRTDRSRKYTVQASYIEIYDKNVYDLLDTNKSKPSLEVFESKEGVPIVQNLIKQQVHSLEEVTSYLKQGQAARHVAATDMNAHSSRSHTILQLTVSSHAAPEALGLAAPSMSSSSSSMTASSSRPNTANMRGLQATLNLVDLAGSERAKQTNAEGQRLKEAANINNSLMVLSEVIRSLSAQGKDSGKHINFRNSVLTRLLKPSLGGNAYTCILCCVTPAVANNEQTISTLRFAQNAKKVRNSVSVNEFVDVHALVARLRQEVAELRQRLQELDPTGAHATDSNKRRRSNSIVNTESAASAAPTGIDEEALDASLSYSTQSSLDAESTTDAELETASSTSSTEGDERDDGVSEEDGEDAGWSSFRERRSKLDADMLSSATLRQRRRLQHEDDRERRLQQMTEQQERIAHLERMCAELEQALEQNQSSLKLSTQEHESELQDVRGDLDSVHSLYTQVLANHASFFRREVAWLESAREQEGTHAAEQTSALACTVQQLQVDAQEHERTQTQVLLQCQALESRVQELEQELQQAQTQCSEERTAAQQLQRRLDENEDKQIDMLNAVSQSARELAARKEAIEELQNELASARSQLDELRVVQQQMRNDIVAAQAHKNDVEERAASLASELVATEQRLGSAEERCAQAFALDDKRRAQVSKLQDQHEEDLRAIAELEHQVKELKQELECLQSVHQTSLQDRNVERSRVESSLRTEIARHKATIEELENAAADADADREATAVKMDELEREIERLKQELEAATQRASLADSLLLVERNHAATVTNQMSSMQEEVRDLTLQVHEADLKHKVNVSALEDNWRQRLTRAESETEAAKRQLELATREMARLQKELHSAVEQSDKMQQVEEAWAAEKRTLIEQHRAAMQEQAHALQHVEQKARSTQAMLTDQLNELTSTASAETSKLRTALADLQAAGHSVEESLRAERTARAAAEKALSRARTELVAHESVAGKLQEELKNVRADLVLQQDQHQRQLDSKARSLRDQLEALKSSHAIELHDHEQRLKERVEETVKWRSKCEQQEQAISAMEAKHKTEVLQISSAAEDALLSAVADMQQECQSKLAKLEQAKQDLEANLTDQCSKIEASKLMLESRISSLQRVHELQLRELQTQHELALEQHKAVAAQSEASKDAQFVRIRDQTGHVDQLKEENRRLNDLLVSALRKVETLESDPRASDSALRDDLTKQREHVKKLTASADESKRLIISLKSECERLKLELADREHTHTEAVATLENEIADLKKRIPTKDMLARLCRSSRAIRGDPSS